jgi:spectinomycin phosphotransferase
VFAEDPRIDRDAIAEALRAHWDLDVSLTYVPVGFGTHHYLARDGDRRWFVNVDDLCAKTWIADDLDARVEGLHRQLRTAVALRDDAGLEFVHAPIANRDGGVLVRTGDFVVSLFDHLDGESRHDDGKYLSEDERIRALEAVRSMHAATALIDQTLPPVETYAVPARARFLELVEDLDAPWTGGPFSDAVRDLMREWKTSVLERMERFDDLVRSVVASSPERVITHGEPHAANVMWTSDGLKLIDWDTVALGPRERDFWMVAPAEAADPMITKLFSERWVLWEITGYTITLHDPHIDDANTKLMFEELKEYLGA